MCYFFTKKCCFIWGYIMKCPNSSQLWSNYTPRSSTLFFQVWKHGRGRGLMQVSQSFWVCQKAVGSVLGLCIIPSVVWSVAAKCRVFSACSLQKYNLMQKAWWTTCFAGNQVDKWEANTLFIRGLHVSVPLSIRHVYNCITSPFLLIHHSETEDTDCCSFGKGICVHYLLNTRFQLINSFYFNCLLRDG